MRMASRAIAFARVSGVPAMEPEVSMHTKIGPARSAGRRTSRSTSATSSIASSKRCGATPST